MSTIGSNEYYLGNSSDSNGISEIEEVIEEEEAPRDLFELSNHGRGESSMMMKTIKEEVEGSLFSIDVNGNYINIEEADSVYVAVGKSESSTHAVSWALSHAPFATILYLIHIFPEIKHIPSPLGKLPKNQVSPEQVEIYMEQERGKRRQLLQKYLTMCSSQSSSNYKINVDTILIESDDVAKAISDLIPILHIPRLVLGTSKSNARKLKLGRGGNCIAEQVLHNAPENCQVNIICEGLEVNNEDQTFKSPSPRPATLSASSSFKLKSQDDTPSNDPFSCMCFGSKAT
jgi:hypothetical protein